MNELVEQVQQVKKFRVVNQPAASRLFNEPETRPHRKQHEDEDETGCKPGLDDWRCAGHLLGHIDGNLASMLLLLKYKLQTHSTIKNMLRAVPGTSLQCKHSFCFRPRMVQPFSGHVCHC